MLANVSAKLTLSYSTASTLPFPSRSSCRSRMAPAKPAPTMHTRKGGGGALSPPRPMLQQYAWMKAERATRRGVLGQNLASHQRFGAVRCKHAACMLRKMPWSTVAGCCNL